MSEVHAATEPGMSMQAKATFKHLNIDPAKLKHVPGEPGRYDYDGNVNWDSLGLKKFPLKLRNVSGYFSIADNFFESLRGGPSRVEGGFDCYGNRLRDLDGAPLYVGKNFSCGENYLPKNTKVPGVVMGRLILGEQKAEAHAAAEPDSSSASASFDRLLHALHSPRTFSSAGSSITLRAKGNTITVSGSLTGEIALALPDVVLIRDGSVIARVNVSAVESPKTLLRKLLSTRVHAAAELTSIVSEVARLAKRVHPSNGRHGHVIAPGFSVGAFVVSADRIDGPCSLECDVEIIDDSRAHMRLYAEWSFKQGVDGPVLNMYATEYEFRKPDGSYIVAKAPGRAYKSVLVPIRDGSKLFHTILTGLKKLSARVHTYQLKFYGSDIEEVQAAAEAPSKKNLDLLKKIKLDPRKLEPVPGRKGVYDYVGDVNWNNIGLRKFPLKLRYVHGDFWCSSNYLTSLVGGPEIVDGDCFVSFNHLTSLTGAPAEVGKGFSCSNNSLTSLEGAPGIVGGNFICRGNNLPPDTQKPAGIHGDFMFAPQRGVAHAASEAPPLTNEVVGMIRLLQHFPLKKTISVDINSHVPNRPWKVSIRRGVSKLGQSFLALSVRAGLQTFTAQASLDLFADVVLQVRGRKHIYVGPIPQQPKDILRYLAYVFVRELVGEKHVQAAAEPDVTVHEPARHFIWYREMVRHTSLSFGGAVRRLKVAGFDVELAPGSLGQFQTPYFHVKVGTRSYKVVPSTNGRPGLLILDEASRYSIGSVTNLTSPNTKLLLKAVLEKCVKHARDLDATAQAAAEPEPRPDVGHRNLLQELDSKRTVSVRGRNLTLVPVRSRWMVYLAGAQVPRYAVEYHSGSYGVYRLTNSSRTKDGLDRNGNIIGAYIDSVHSPVSRRDLAEKALTIILQHLEYELRPTAAAEPAKSITGTELLQMFLNLNHSIHKTKIKVGSDDVLVVSNYSAARPTLMLYVNGDMRTPFRAVMNFDGEVPYANVLLPSLEIGSRTNALTDSKALLKWAVAEAVRLWKSGGYAQAATEPRPSMEAEELLSKLKDQIRKRVDGHQVKAKNHNINFSVDNIGRMKIMAHPEEFTLGLAGPYQGLALLVRKEDKWAVVRYFDVDSPGTLMAAAVAAVTKYLEKERDHSRD